MTSTGKGEPTDVGAQSETAVNVSNASGKQIITVTYNDDTDTANKIDYTASTRTTKSGATLMGWSYSLDTGKTWAYGGSITPLAAWPVLWGDPAITSDFADQRYVFISNLAVPAAKMPASGAIQGPLNSYLGGACIARSQDGGINFKLAQCVSDNNDFYDGGSMVAAGSGSDRRVFAAFVDIDTERIDVWAAPNDTGSFSLIANPFPGMSIHSHPRLRFDRDSDALLVGALDGIGQLWLNRFTGGAWGTPRLASLPSAGNPDITLSDRLLRTGYQFSYDVGAASQNQDDGIRVAYTVSDARSGKLYIRGSRCTFNLTACRDAPEWGTTPGNLNLHGQQFNPKLRAFAGFFGLEPVWKLTYESTDDNPGGNKVSHKEGNLAVLPNGTRIFIPFDLIAAQLVCPDNRGYWGDYDELQFAGFAKDSTAPRFVLANTDSSAGCPTRWQYTSNQVHVAAVVFK